MIIDFGRHDPETCMVCIQRRQVSQAIVDQIDREIMAAVAEAERFRAETFDITYEQSGRFRVPVLNLKGKS